MRHYKEIWALALIALVLVVGSLLLPKVANAKIVAEGTAVASWYGPCCYGNKTADGTTFTKKSVGVAHRTFGFDVRCTFKYKGKTLAKVRVFDRGPHVKGRTWDLSNAVARKLSFSGVQDVQYSCWVPGK